MLWTPERLSSHPESGDPVILTLHHTHTHNSVHKGNRIYSNNLLHKLIREVVVSKTEMDEHNLNRNEKRQVSGESQYYVPLSPIVGLHVSQVES